MVKIAAKDLAQQANELVEGHRLVTGANIAKMIEILEQGNAINQA